MRVLFDLDSTISDWDNAFDGWLDHFTEVMPSAAGIPRRHQRTCFNLKQGMSPEQSDIIDGIMDIPGFYADLDPIDGAVEAVLKIAESHDVLFVSSPWNTNPTCNDDKKEWIKFVFGDEWADRLILTKDKTLIRGDILIDDKPTITGRDEPEWMHIVYSAPYNMNIAGPRIENWHNWEEVIEWADSSVLAVGSKLAKTLWPTTSLARAGSSSA